MRRVSLTLYVAVTLLSLAALGETEEKNLKAFKSLQVYPQILTNLEAAVGPYRAQLYKDAIGRQYDNDAVMTIVEKYVAAGTQYTEAQREEAIEAKLAVLDVELAVEKEIWRRILAPAIPAEDQLEAAVEAVSGEYLIVSLAKNYRTKSATELAKLRKTLDKNNKEEQERRYESWMTSVRGNTMAFLNKFADDRSGRVVGARTPTAPASKSGTAPESMKSIPKATNGAADLRSREEVKAEILAEQKAKAEKQAPAVLPPGHQN